MHKGKYPRTTAKQNVPVVLIISLVLLAAAVGSTAAYYRTTSRAAVNTFTPAEVIITPSESKTDTTKSDITFRNDGNIPVYIRSTLVIYWTDTFDLTDDGVDNPTEQIVPMPQNTKVEGGSTLGANWFQPDGGDIYYYSLPVAPGSSTEVMLNPITVTVPDGSTAQCHIDVRAEAIQTEPESAVETAWKDVKVDSNGSLESAA